MFLLRCTVKRNLPPAAFGPTLDVFVGLGYDLPFAGEVKLFTTTPTQVIVHERLRMQARAKRKRDSAQPEAKGAAIK